MSESLAGSPSSPEVEVLAKARRRRFTAADKIRVLKEADACTRPGDVGALLRREGLYSSHLAVWRAARTRGELAGLSAVKRGPKAKGVDPHARRIAELERENQRLKARAERAETLVEVQKKLSELLGLPLATEKSERRV